MQDAKLHHQAPPRLTPGTTAMVETLQALGAQGSGCLYRLVDPDGSADRALSESAGKGYGRIKHPFVAQVPEKRLYLQPMGGASLVLGDGLARGSSSRRRAGNRAHPRLTPRPGAFLRLGL